ERVDDGIIATQIAVDRWARPVSRIKALQLSQQLTLSHDRVCGEGTIPVMARLQLWQLMQVVAVVNAKEKVTQCPTQFACRHMHLPTLMHGLKRRRQTLPNIDRNVNTAAADSR